MSDLISRDELLRYVNERIDKIKEIRDSAKRNGEEDVFAHCNGEITEARMTKLHLNMFAPAVDAVPVVHARWVHEQRYGDSGGWVWRCTACRREAISPIISALKYCHACGAKMEGGAEG